MAIVNIISLRKKFETLSKAKKFEDFAFNAANVRFIAAKDNMLEELMEHPVSKEIEDACADPSITQADIVSKGNIASAIGFYKDSTPVQELELFLRNNTEMNDSAKITFNQNKATYSFKVNVPSKNDLYEAFPSPDNWTSRSWIDMIENGISFLAKYIFWSEGFKKSNSRSTTGLQLKRGSVKNVATFTPKQYITEILNNFKAYFKK